MEAQFSELFATVFIQSIRISDTFEYLQETSRTRIQTTTATTIKYGTHQAIILEEKL